MSDTTIGHLTFDELRQFILSTLAEIQTPAALQPRQVGSKTPAAWHLFLEGFIDQPDAPSPRQMLREARDQ